MKKNLLLTLLFSTSVSLMHAGEIEKTVDAFTTVSVTGNYKISMIESTEEKVTISNNDANVTDDKILITVEGGTLDIKIKGDTYKERQIEVTIYYKKVYQIDAKRGARVTVNNTLKGDVITFNCSTGGQVKSTIEAGTAKMKISNDGLINVSGTATIAELEVNAGGTLVASLLIVETASATVSVGGSIRVNASKKLIASASVGHVSYKGNPEVLEKTEKLGGTVTPLNEK